MKTMDEISSQILDKINEFRWLLDELRSGREPTPDDLIILQGNLKDSILSIEVIDGGICPECSGTGKTILAVGYQGNDPYMGESKCPNCKGTGTLDKTILNLIEEARKELG